MTNEQGINNRQANSERVNKIESILETNGVDKNSQNSSRETYQETRRLDKSVSAHKDTIDSHNRTINYAQSNSSEYSKDQYQDVADAYQAKYGGSAREVQEAVSSGTARARAVHKELNAKSYDSMFKQINTKGDEIAGGSNVDDFVTKNKIDSAIGSRRDEFAKANNIRTDKDNITQEISDKGRVIKDRHTEKRDYNENEYEEREQIHGEKQAARQKEINEHEKDRKGKGRGSRILDGLGRPSQQVNKNDLDFEPIAHPYEPKIGKYNWETGKIDPLSQESGLASKLNPIRPPEEGKFFDKKDAQNIMEQFKPNTTTRNNEEIKEKSRADGQYGVRSTNPRR